MKPVRHVRMSLELMNESDPHWSLGARVACPARFYKAAAGDIVMRRLELTPSRTRADEFQLVLLA